MLWLARYEWFPPPWQGGTGKSFSGAIIAITIQDTSTIRVLIDLAQVQEY